MLFRSTLLSSKSNGKIYNVGFGKPIKIKDVVKTIKSLVGTGKPVYGSFKLRKNENIKLFPSIKKITKEIGWKPKVKLHDGLIKTIKYYKNN